MAMASINSRCTRIASALYLLCVLFSQAQQSPTNSSSGAGNDLAQNAQTANDLLRKASDNVDSGNLDEALSSIDAALQLDSSNSQAYELRGSIYIQKKLWDRAEDDYLKALSIDPSSVAFKYKLAEIKFLQQSFDIARIRFAALRNDPGLGDLAAYKVFLCDLQTGQEDLAASDLAQINRGEKKPSYYFCNAVWDMYHHKKKEANALFTAAADAYSDSVNDLYISSLKELNDFHAPVVSFVTKDGVEYNQVSVFVENDGLRVSSSRGWITVPFAQLPGDLSMFPLELREQIAAKNQMTPAITTDPPLLSFTTKNGKQYNRVQWSVDGDGLHVLTADGWIRIPAEQLPEDPVAFPAEVREKITAERKSSPEAESVPQPLTFTTKKGELYDHVRWFIGDDGLHVLTSDGWMAVPFSQLPDNLSGFPAELREQIPAKMKAIPMEGKEAPSSSATDRPDSDAVSGAPSANSVPLLDAEQFDFYPPEARDCCFGNCLAVEGATLAIGDNGAIYIYEDDQLKARLCPGADLTRTGDLINSISISNHTMAAGTPSGIYIWIDTPQGWKLQTRLNITNASSVALDGDNLVVGTNGNGTAANKIFFFNRKGDAWQSIPKSVDRDGNTFPSDLFGHIAAIKGTLALIGLPNLSQSVYDGASSGLPGRAFVEKYQKGAWEKETQLSVSDRDAEADQFGESVALSSDEIAVSGSNRDTTSYTSRHGAVYVFGQASEAWRQTAKITSPVPGNGEEFGAAPIVLSGHTLAIGDPGVKVNVPNVILDNGQSSGKPGEIKQAGAVYVYENHFLQATLTAPDPVDNLRRDGSPDQYACSLAMDRDIIAVGAKDKDGGAGAVYVWKRENNKWHLDLELKGFHQQPDFNY